MALIDYSARSGGVVITGPSGIGKSGLLRHVLRSVDPRFHVVTVFASAVTADILFGSFLPLLPPRLAETAERRVLLAGVLDWFQGLAAQSRVILAVDDIQHLDPLSAALVHHAVHSHWCLLAATHRTGTVVHDLITALWRADLTETIRLRPLDEPAVSDLATAALGGPVDANVVQRLWNLSQGNVLVIREIIEASLDQSSLAVERGLWRWTSDARVHTSTTDLIAKRIAALPRPVRVAVEFVALAEPVPRATIVELTSDDAVRDGLVSGLLREHADQGQWMLRLDHPMHAEAVHRVLDDHDRRDHVARLARLTEARRPDEVVRLCCWHIDHGIDVDTTTLTAGARIAYESRDLRMAVVLARAAVEAGAGFDAIEVLATGLGFSCAPVEAVDLLMKTESRLSTDDERIRWNIVRALVAYNSLHSLSIIDKVLAEASRLESPERDVLHVLAACLRLGGGDFVDAWGDLATILADARTTLQARLFAEAMTAGVGAARGEPDAAGRYVSMEQSTSDHYTTWPVLRVVAGFARWNAVLVTGQIDRLGPGQNTEAIRYFPIIDVHLLLLQAVVCRLRGELRMARDVAIAAWDLVEGGGGDNFAVAVSAELAHAAALLGDLRLAEAAIARCDKLYQPTMALQYPMIELARLQITATLGEPDRAASQARALAIRLHADGMHGYEVHAVHHLARIGRVDSADHARATDLARRIPEPLPEAVAAHLRGLHDRDTTALAEARRRFRELNLRLFAAEVGVQRFGLMRAAREPGTGRFAEELAGDLTGFEARSLPAMAMPRSSLTTREQEIADLVRAGATTIEIRARLVIDKRTVNSHLYRIYRKLGAREREDVAGIMALDDLLARLVEYGSGQI